MIHFQLVHFVTDAYSIVLQVLKSTRAVRLHVEVNANQIKEIKRWVFHRPLFKQHCSKHLVTMNHLPAIRLYFTTVRSCSVNTKQFVRVSMYHL